MRLKCWFLLIVAIASLSVSAQEREVSPKAVERIQ